VRTSIGTSIAGTRVLAEGPDRTGGEDAEGLEVEGPAPSEMDTGEVVLGELVAALGIDTVTTGIDADVDESVVVVKFMKLDPNLVSSVSTESCYHGR